ncbi:hypothetical protein MACJ_000491 [Theileria orientalis]|uniref:Uncharacterized protein n=1 Tax=Theileria orientalis TaxID=68886 RepID=A0A976M446_THEOR|nr:hypothetical protein MACJ_000491 [Theileria orientalis]
MDSLDNYEDEAELLPIIIKENNKLNRQLTFKVESSQGGSNFKKHNEDINRIFERVTFMADTNPLKRSRSNGTYELYCSQLLENGKNCIDNETVKEYNSQPFNAVCVYYYKTEKIALLIELVENYALKLIRRQKSNGNSKWVKDDRKIQCLCNDELTNYLKIILVCLKNKIVIRLDKQNEYTDNKVIDTVSKDTESTENNKNITPTNNSTASPRKYSGYICYNHNLKEYYDKNLENILGKLESSSTFKFDIFLEIGFRISDRDISICSSGSQKEYLFYKPGPGPPGDNVYVYFYEKGEKDVRPDTVPLMLQFKDNFYGPSKKENYFTEWRKINGSQSLTDTSDLNGHIKSELDKINKSFNHICLNQNVDYGLTGLNGFTKTGESNFDPVRVRVLKNQVPAFRASDPIRSDNIYCEYSVYSKYIHSTVNTFQLGDIQYNCKNVVQENARLTSNGTFEIKSGQNQLTVYYLTKDQSFEYPLLIGIGKHDAIDDFYKLESKDSDYKWKKLEESEKGVLKKGTDTREIIKILDIINYALKKTARIEIAKRIPYLLKGKPISPSSPTFSPINNHKVKVGQNHACEPIWQAGYRRLFHNISEIPNFNYCLIGSVEVYIPDELTKENISVNDPNQKIKLYKIKNSDHAISEKIINATSFSEISSFLEENTPIYYTSCKPEVFVYFYRDDPRPGLLCLGDTTYKPIQLPQLESGKYTYKVEDHTSWVGIRRTKKCVCENEMELKFLTDVLDRLYFSSAFDKFISEYWVTLSVGAGGGVVGVGSLAGGGYVLFSYITGMQLLL